MNIVIAIFVLLLGTLLVFGIPCNLGVKWLPKIVQQIFPYGKVSKGLVTIPLVKLILVPKRWFSHFYLFAIIYTLGMASAMFMKLFGRDLPVMFETYISTVSYHSNEPLGYSIPSLLATCLFLLHVTRRWYECMFVSIFSSAMMNLAHYFSGYLHYWGCATVLIAYSGTSYQQEFQPLVVIQLLMGIGLFIYASHQQHLAHVTFANFRKDSSKKDKYVIPKGGLFDYISCPNYFCEILIYVSLYLILGFGHYPWVLISIWVITNQMMAATMSHNWYKKHFEDYPTLRKAIIPFIF